MTDKIKKGQKSLSARQLNDAATGGELARKTTVRGGNLKKIPGAGTVIDATKHKARSVGNGLTILDVVVKKAPSLNAGWVTVQQVQEKDWPIQPCTDSACRIQTFGPEFDVRPYFGRSPESYTTYEASAELGPSTTFFQCRWDGRLWRLDAPAAGGGAGVELCTVRGPMTGTAWTATSDFIKINKWKKNPNYNPLGIPPNPIDTRTHIWVGASVEPLGYTLVQCWPGTKEIDWQFFQSATNFPPDTNLAATTIWMAAIKISGTEYIAPLFFGEAGLPDSGTLAGDC
jgi:hypothetical protein